MGGFGKFIWNSETRKFCGRSGRSWGEIGIYYLFYYIALTAFYSATICGFYWLISPLQPRLTMSDAVHEGNPGMGFRPHFRELHTTLIHRSKVMQEFNKKNINNFIEEEGYKVVNSSRLASPVCTQLQNSDACLIVIHEQDMGPCTNASNYGYTYDKDGKHGTPCVLIKLNKIYGWEPKLTGKKPEGYEDFPGGDISYSSPLSISQDNEINKKFFEEYVPVSCNGESAVDKENIQEIKYYPVQGIHKRYFPFKSQRSPNKYQSPFVFAEIKTTPGVVVYVECRAWAENIEYVGDTQETRKGSVHFELLADE